MAASFPTSPATRASNPSDSHTPDPRVLSNSSMWQSERWNHAVTKIPRKDGIVGTLQLGWRLIRERRNYDVIYTVGIREAQVYGLLCSVFGTGGKPHVASEILLDDFQPASFSWRLKRGIRRFALRRTAKIIVFSSGERELYSRELQVPIDRVEFVPFHTNILEPKFTPPGSYGFAAGRSLRDYKTLFAAVDGLDIPFVVVADRASVAHLRKPDNVELHCDIPRARYLELLEGARFVVVPLKAEFRSTGQVVVLEAASLGKPVIASNVVGVRDYITDGVDGLLAEPSNQQALRERIQLVWSDENLRGRLAGAAMERINREHTFPVFADKCLRIMSSACGQR